MSHSQHTSLCSPVSDISSMLPRTLNRWICFTEISFCLFVCLSEGVCVCDCVCECMCMRLLCVFCVCYCVTFYVYAYTLYVCVIVYTVHVYHSDSAELYICMGMVFFILVCLFVLPFCVYRIKTIYI